MKGDGNTPALKDYCFFYSYSHFLENRMFSLWGLVAFLCLHQRTFCSAFQTSRVEVEYGEPAVLHCDGSVLKEEEVQEGVVHWELRGEDVVILRGEAQVSEKFKGRVELPSEEQIREGNWSVVLTETRLKDADMYECIFGGATTVSTVWLSVSATEPVEASTVEPIRTSQEMVTLLSDQVNGVEAIGFPTELRDLLEDSTQLIQDDGNLLSSDPTNTQQTETFEEKETFSDKDDLDATWNVFQLGDFPWVRIGIIGGVLLITAVVLCVLRALHHI
ncbi:uncharacterized protein LOC103156203 [Poecilia formosa]|uniref:uncharacterized protein LOC103156203 n=1 Tax=Poecilia formosa TaxID=48698 RepID=UPI000443A44D|nr:PREDICTED: uncharacterized protein LOC103156203 [Poecilia formosa]